MELDLKATFADHLRILLDRIYQNFYHDPEDQYKAPINIREYKAPSAIYLVAITATTTYEKPQIQTKNKFYKT